MTTVDSDIFRAFIAAGVNYELARDATLAIMRYGGRAPRQPEVSPTIEEIGTEIAREALSDPEFREELRTLIRECSRSIMASLRRTRGES